MKIDFNKNQIGQGSLANNGRNGVNFGAAAFERIKQNGELIYRGANTIVNGVDKVLGGDNFLRGELNKAGIHINNDTITIKDANFLTDLASTVKTPFFNLPFNILNNALKLMRKTPLAPTADKIAENPFIAHQFKRIQKEKSYALARDILEKFTSYSPVGDIGVCSDRFAKSASSKVGAVARNYASRDERTLNRLATATVSALYSANDFYNISLLENDDKNKAQRAEKSRKRQEFTRMGITATLTFLTMGALNKYIKGKLVVNALVIAGSTLASETLSRLLNKKSLVPVSSEKAAQIAKRDHVKIKEAQKETPQISYTSSKNDAITYKKFAYDGVLPSVQKMEREKRKDNTDTTKHKLLKIGGIALLAANAIYFLKKGISGEYWLKIKKASFMSSSELVKKFDSGLEMKPEEYDLLKSNLRNIRNDYNSMFNRRTIFDEIRKIIMTKEVPIDHEEVLNTIERIKQTQDGANMAGILDDVADHVRYLQARNTDNSAIRIPRLLPQSIYKGFTKIFDTFYNILSAPGKGINHLLNKMVFDEASASYDKIADKMLPQDSNKFTPEYEKQLENFVQMMLDARKKKGDQYEILAKQIKMSTRNFEEGAATGDLANLARTLVTFISTYFFVTDYYNAAMIESGGTNVKGANEVKNERLMQKLFNFIINGTLMNLFNSIGKVPLNASLVGATAIAAATETTNEFLVRKSICQPVRKMKSRDAIIKYEEDRMNRRGFMGWWTRTFKKLTGKKSLTQKAHIDTKKTAA